MGFNTSRYNTNDGNVNLIVSVVLNSNNYNYNDYFIVWNYIDDNYYQPYQHQNYQYYIINGNINGRVQPSMSINYKYDNIGMVNIQLQYLQLLKVLYLQNKRN